MDIYVNTYMHMCIEREENKTVVTYIHVCIKREENNIVVCVLAVYTCLYTVYQLCISLHPD